MKIYRNEEWSIMNRFKRVFCCLAAVMVVSALFAAESTISLTATPRYPWNGLVDLAFTIAADDADGGYADPEPEDELIEGRRLKYVRSLGDVQLNTGVVLGSKNTVELKFEWEDNPSCANECLFCARGASASASTFTGFLIGTKWRFDYNSAVGGDTNAVVLETGVPYLVRDEAGTVSVNGTVVRELSPSEFTVGGPLTLFASYMGSTSTSVDNYLAGKVYYLKIFDDDGVTLLHDFVPWEQNGKVGLYDLVAKNFISTSVGTLYAGTKYNTSFAAEDVAGESNLTMRTIYKHTGSVVNINKECLLPGTYNWLWDAPIDLTSKWLTYSNCVPVNSSVLFKDVRLEDIAEFYAVPCGKAVSNKSNFLRCTKIKTDGIGKAVQFAFSDDVYTKCVCAYFEQSGADVVGYIKWARYVSGTGREGEDFDANSATTYTIATTETASGYGLCKIEALVPQHDSNLVLDRVVVKGTSEKVLDISTGTYMVIDLAGGSGASAHPVSYLDGPPPEGWTDDYKSTKLLLRRVEAQTYYMGSQATDTGHQSNETYHKVTLSRPYYIAVAPLTCKQYYLLMGSGSQTLDTMTMNWGAARGWDIQSTSSGALKLTNLPGETGSPKKLDFTVTQGTTVSNYGWPDKSGVDTASLIGKLRSTTGLQFDLPTEAQWELACKGSTSVGEWCLDVYSGNLGTAAVVDPIGPTISGNTKKSVKASAVKIWQLDSGLNWDYIHCVYDGKTFKQAYYYSWYETPVYLTFNAYGVQRVVKGLTNRPAGRSYGLILNPNVAVYSGGVLCRRVLSGDYDKKSTYKVTKPSNPAYGIRLCVPAK